MKNSDKILIITIIMILICTPLFAEEFLMPESDTISNQSEKQKKTEDFFLKPYFENILPSTISQHLNFYKNDELFIVNPNASYDANFKYKFDINLYDRKLKVVPKIRISRKLEEKINNNSETGIDSIDPENKKNIDSEIEMPTATSSQTNSIFVGMDLSYALNKSIYLDSNLSFYQTALEINDKNLATKEHESAYRYEGNAMSLSIGLRKQLTDSISAGLIYSWKKWLDEDEDFSEAEPVEDTKASEDSQKALNFMLRYDF